MHPHCDKCFVPSICKFVARSVDDAACPLKSCPYECGAKLHECKIADHALLCWENVVPCLNAYYGCATNVKRKNLHKHLRRCRAYVVECGAEWNRWPVNANSRKKLKELATPVRYSDDKIDESVVELDNQSRDIISSPLDFAFALNDQNKVVDSLRLPGKLRKFYKNAYTPGHPVLPLPLPHRSATTMGCCDFRGENRRSNSTDLTSVSECSDSPCKNIKQIPGLAASLLENLTNNNDSNVAKGGLSYHVSPDIIVCNHGNENVTPPSFGFKKTNYDSLVNSDNSSDSDEEEENERKFDSIKMEFGKPIYCILCQQRITSTTNPTNSINNNNSLPDTAAEATANRQTPGQVTVEINELYKDYRLHLQLYPDFLGSCQPKPKSIYSFRCGKVLQCNEYANHYQTLHCDLIDSLDDWIVVRCPLFHRGCDFYTFRWSFNQGSDKLIFDQWQQCFAMASNDDVIATDGDRPWLDLLRLPFHVLCHVTSFLDPFTLNNLSLVCTTLREAARSQLNSKGLVELVWRKVITDDNKVKWETNKKVRVLKIRAWENAFELLYNKTDT